MIKPTALLAVALLAGWTAPAVAQTAIGQPPIGQTGTEQPGPEQTGIEHFDRIEARYQEADRLPAARAQFAAAIPAGTSAGVARRIVADAGGRCHPGANGAAIQCSFANVYDDYRRSDFVRWEVRLTASADRIETVTVRRFSDPTDY